MVFSTITAAASGAMGLFSGVKGLFDSAKAARKRKALMREGKAAEAAWYRRNYYGDFMNDTATRAAMKRVEDTLSRNSRQNRAYAAVTGATPEISLARNEQGLDALGNVVTNIAAQEDSRRASVDAQHLQNQSSLYNQELQNLMYNDSGADEELLGGVSLIEQAIEGVNWGNEFNKIAKKKEK